MEIATLAVRVQDLEEDLRPRLKKLKYMYTYIHIQNYVCVYKYVYIYMLII